MTSKALVRCAPVIRVEYQRSWFPGECWGCGEPIAEGEVSIWAPLFTPLAWHVGHQPQHFDLPPTQPIEVRQMTGCVIGNVCSVRPSGNPTPPASEGGRS